MNETLEALDHIRLNFSASSLLSLNIAIAVVMFGVALEIKLQHFKDILLAPKPAIVGFVSQFLVLPILTFALIFLLKDFLTPTMALGMVLVAACPGGNISNFISSMAKANVALSVSLTAIATLSAIILTPLNFAFWGKMVINLYANASATTLVRPIEIDTIQVFQTIIIILGIPLILGIFVNTKFPKTTKKMAPIVKKLSVAIFSTIVIIALAKNFDHFINIVQYIFLIVLLHNAIAITSGYGMGKLFKLSFINRKSISIETGIQNSGLALALIFNPKIFPPELELGGMAVIAAWWGIWHMISGGIIAAYWGTNTLDFLPWRKTTIKS